MSDVNSIRACREQIGLSQEELGQQIGVTRQTIAAWESGDRDPSLVQLVKIARRLGVSVELLLNLEADNEAEQPEVCLLFRADEPSALTSALRAALTEKAMNYATVEQLLAELPSLPEQRPLSGYDEYLVEEVAKEVRGWLGVGESAPLGDVLALLEAKRLKVILQPLPESISGFSAYTDTLGTVIFINQDHPTERKFFTALHELAHLIFHRQEYKTGLEPLTPSRNRKHPREKAADHLAGAILLSEDSIRKELHAYRNRWLPEPLLADLKRRYGVSLRTIIRRAGQIGIISQKQMGQQLGVLNKKYPDVEEPQLPPPSGLTRLERLVYLALIREEITASRAAEILGKSLVEAREELNRWMEEESV